jgi:glycosyltransferase involved in cell wall biosynthesis
MRDKPGVVDPTISILVVTFNEKKNLPGLFASLRNQTDRNFDLIVIDGQSSDGSYALIKGADDIVTHHVSEPDFGFYDALNKAVRAVRTDFYLVLGADDRIEPDAIANFRGAAGEADVVVAAVKAGPHLRMGYHPGNAWIGPSRTMTSHSVGTLIRTSLHEIFGFYSFRYPTLADWHFLKRVFAAPAIRVNQLDFLAGTFAMDGVSNSDPARTLCELWLVQRESGENALVQYSLFQARLLLRIFRVIRFVKVGQVPK